jgi:hypothetical protein
MSGVRKSACAPAASPPRSTVASLAKTSIAEDSRFAGASCSLRRKKTDTVGAGAAGDAGRAARNEDADRRQGDR